MSNTKTNEQETAARDQQAADAEGANQAVQDLSDPTYPCYLYRDGDPSQDSMLCGAKEIEADWSKRGFAREGLKPLLHKLPVPDAPAAHAFAKMAGTSPRSAPDATDPSSDSAPTMKVNPDTKASEGVTSAKRSRK